MNPKDKILRDIKEFKKPHDIKNLSKHLYELEKDGFVKIIYTTDGDIVTLRLTREGERFLDGGGYTARYKSERNSKISAKAWAAITFVLGIVLTELVHILAEWLKQ